MQEGRVKKKLALYFSSSQLRRDIRRLKANFHQEKGPFSDNEFTSHETCVASYTSEGQWSKKTVFKMISNHNKITDEYDGQELHTKFPVSLIYIPFHILHITFSK